jgi:lincosamide nucleotidyltransferase A/C/D/E
MDAEQALEILDFLADARVTAWVDGGWGIDALIGETTRPHSDLDLVVPLPRTDEILGLLGRAGYDQVLRDLRPTAIAVSDGVGREIDLHLVTPTVDGGGDQAQPGGGRFHYPAPTTGTIGGRPVQCVDAETQVRAHLGYPPTQKDHRDMRALHERLGVRLPAPYLRTGEW